MFIDIYNIIILQRVTIMLNLVCFLLFTENLHSGCSEGNLVQVQVLFRALSYRVFEIFSATDMRRVVNSKFTTRLYLFDFYQVKPIGIMMI